jgi:hypothetical protein
VDIDPARFTWPRAQAAAVGVAAVGEEGVAVVGVAAVGEEGVAARVVEPVPGAAPKRMSTAAASSHPSA